MSFLTNAPVCPRNGHTLIVGIVARISGCKNQKEISLEDQVDHGKQVVADLYEGPVEYRIISTKGKGERLDRPELAEIEQLLRTRELDLLVAEDIGRMVRGTEAVHLCGIAVDYGTRVLAPNDCIDTAEDTWEEDVISACRDHVGHNAHTSKRLKQKLMNRFIKFGGATPREVYGYIKPAGAKTLDDWQKDPAATPIIQEGFRRLKETLNCSIVADWFNQQGISVGKYCRRKTWDSAMVRRFYANPILKGLPGRGFTRTIKHHETGRRIAAPNPKGPTFRECPHLAHLDAVEFDELNELLSIKNKDRGRKQVNGIDPRFRIPWKRTRFPGQHAVCWYCGRHYVWGGNGTPNSLMCSGARLWLCWNSFSVHGPTLAGILVQTITGELYKLEGIDAQFREIVQRVTQDRSEGVAARWQRLQDGEATLGREKENMMAAIRQFGPLPMFQEQLDEFEAKQKEFARERHRLESLHSRELKLPNSINDLREQLESEFRHLAIESLEFGDLMRQLVPEIHVWLVRSVDGGHPLPRAKVKLDLSGVVPDAQYVPGLGDLLTREVTLDLFEAPQRERIRVQAVRLINGGLTQRQVAMQLSEPCTQPAVQDALALDQKMRQLGMESPYVILRAPPEDYHKLHRHLHPRYRFTPLAGYQQPAI